MGVTMRKTFQCWKEYPHYGLLVFRKIYQAMKSDFDIDDERVSLNRGLEDA